MITRSGGGFRARAGARITGGRAITDGARARAGVRVTDGRPDTGGRASYGRRRGLAAEPGAQVDDACQCGSEHALVEGATGEPARQRDPRLLALTGLLSRAENQVHPCPDRPDGAVPG